MISSFVTLPPPFTRYCLIMFGLSLTVSPFARYSTRFSFGAACFCSVFAMLISFRFLVYIALNSIPFVSKKARSIRA